jgi:nicotinamide phosphoribosyltransferase
MKTLTRKTKSVTPARRLVVGLHKHVLKKTGCLEENFLDLSDSYKDGHWKMLPAGTENVYSYDESRVGAKYPYTTFVGLQMYLMKYFTGVVVTQNDIDEAVEDAKLHFGQDLFNRIMWEKIVNVYGGKLPLVIRAVPEGTSVPVGNVLFTIRTSVDDPILAPLTNYVETILTHVWQASNVATISRDIRVFFEKALEQSAETKDLLPFMLHDFGFRGVSSVESAGLGGVGHLVNFMGTDTKIALRYARRYYGVRMAGYSVPASEHSVMTALGEAGEFDTIRRLIKEFPNGILSLVFDSFNIERAIKEYLVRLKTDVLARDGKLVIRPDSPRYKGDTAASQIVWIAEELEKIFGSTKNKKGYKVLNPKIGIIYGDGLNADEIKEAVIALMKNGFSADTCVYGMGGGLLQKHNRDTQRNAFKCSAQKRNGKWVDVQKKPLDMTKASKKGILKLVRHEGAHGATLITVPENDPRQDELVEVFRDGEIVKAWTWDEVKANARIRLLGE